MATSVELWGKFCFPDYLVCNKSAFAALGEVRRILSNVSLFGNFDAAFAFHLA
jgi:hypothetical protein